MPAANPPRNSLYESSFRRRLADESRTNWKVAPAPAIRQLALPFLLNDAARNPHTEQGNDIAGVGEDAPSTDILLA